MAKVKLIVLNVKDKPGSVAEAIRSLAEAGVNVKSVFGWGPGGIVQLTVDDIRKGTKALRASGTDFTEATAEIAVLADKPGTLHAYLAKLAKKGVNLRSIAGSDGKTLVWTAAN
jgi:hypothetical protein